MDEFSLIKTYFQRHQNTESVLVGIGDDCAVLEPPRGQLLVTSIDTQTAGRHFPLDALPNLIAERALRCAISDLAAMGAEPLWFTLALTLPQAEPSWLERFSQGLYAAADQYQICLIGGDTTAGQLSLSIQVHGAVQKDSMMLRSGAKVGDQVFVTGTLGDGVAGLKSVTGQIAADESSRAYLHQRYYRPDARIRAGLLLRYLANSAIDISDGFIADLGHICQASSVGAHIDTTQLPLSPALLANVSPRQALEWALSGGDDYQLCFTVSQENTGKIKKLQREKSLDVTWVGVIVEGDGVVNIANGKPFEIENTGYAHF